VTDKEPFLSRWSQRKRQIAEETRKAAEAGPATPPAPEAEDEPFDLSLLPDLEALTAQTDMSLFLQKGVPDDVRNAALRKIWALDPAIRDYVGDALDYAWDWNAPGGVPGGGELGAGFDTAKMVAQIFGDQPADENVIEYVAAQQDRSELTGLAPNLVDETRSLEPDGPEPLVVSGTLVTDQPTLVPEEVRAALHKKRRHGGAAPIV
jgi:hypothetical protein